MCIRDRVQDPPFYAGKLVASLLTMCGGLRTNTDCQVLDAEDQPIEGQMCIRDRSITARRGSRGMKPWTRATTLRSKASAFPIGMTTRRNSKRRACLLYTS